MQRSLLKLSPQLRVKFYTFAVIPRNVIWAQYSTRHSRYLPQQKHKKTQRLNYERFNKKFSADKNKWVYEKGATTFARELMDTQSKDIGASVEMYELASYLQDTDAASTTLFVRREAKILWHQVYEKCKVQHSHALVTGNPGVGKSRSLVYLLRLLLLDGKTVLFESQKDQMMYGFIPTTGTHGTTPQYEVYSAYLGTFRYKCRLLGNPEHYLLVDPSMASSREIGHVVAHTIIAVSPNCDHFHEWKKRSNVIPFCMPAWTQEELLAVRPCLPIQVNDAAELLTTDEFEAGIEPEVLSRKVAHIQGVISEGLLHERFYIFGGIIRHIFSTPVAMFNDYLPAIRKALNELTLEELVQTLNGNVGAFNSKNGYSSKLFCYKLKHELEPGTTPSYEPSTVVFEFVSPYVQYLVELKYCHDIMSIQNPLSLRCTNSPLVFATNFERLVGILIPHGGIFATRRLHKHGKTQEISKDTKNRDVAEAEREKESAQIPTTDSFQELLRLETVTGHQVTGEWSNFVKEASQLPPSHSKRTTVIFSATKNLPVVDMMDAIDRAYQITTSESHPISAKHMYKLLTATGVTPKMPMKLYFVVPEGRYHHFQHQSFKGISECLKDLEKQGKTITESELEAFLSSRIEQHALCIDTIPVKIIPKLATKNDDNETGTTNQDFGNESGRKRTKKSSEEKI